MKFPNFVPKIVNGKLDFGSQFNESRYRQWLNDNDGRSVEIRLRETKRSLSQNAYYHVYLEVISEETGNAATELHEYFKRVHLLPKFITVLGKEIKVPRSTTELSKHEFSDFLDRICAETNVPLPDTKSAGFISNY